MDNLTIDKIKKYSVELTDIINTSVKLSGEPAQVELLNYIAGELSESKLFSSPIFSYWEHLIGQSQVEIYGYDIDEFDNSIKIFAVDFGEPNHPIFKSDVDKMGKYALNFVDLSLRRDPRFISILEDDAKFFYDDINALNSQQTGIPKINIVIVSNGINNLRSREIKTELKQYKIDVEYIVWDSKWLYQNIKMEAEHESVNLNLMGEELKGFTPEGLPFLEVPQSDSIFSCYQCIVPGTLLSYIYRKYGSPLLEGNVRSFLTTKTAVNKGIQQTIKNCPQRFYIYNNGIAAVASSVTIGVINGERRITAIDDIQIINGGQTTASLAFAEQKRNFDLTRISVPMKLTIINQDQITNENTEDSIEDNYSNVDEYSNIIQTISRTSNSQNKVADADFFANHKFHITMKQLSNALPVVTNAGTTYWFYERARGEYTQQNMFKTDKAKAVFIEQHPKNMYLTKTDFAKYYLILKMQPHIVSKGGVAAFKEFASVIQEDYDNNRQDKYNELFFKEVTAVARMYRLLDAKITKKTISWFEGSYKANIICYALSLFFFILNEQYQYDKFNLVTIWQRGISDDLENFLLNVCREVYYKLVDENRMVENVTQWAKKKECWKEISTSLSNRIKIEKNLISPYLESKVSFSQKQKEAKVIQQDKNQVSMWQLAFSSKYIKTWSKLDLFIQKNPQEFISYTSKDLQIVKSLSALASNKNANIPDDNEIKIAFNILNDAQLANFTY